MKKTSESIFHKDMIKILGYMNIKILTAFYVCAVGPHKLVMEGCHDR